MRLSRFRLAGALLGVATVACSSPTSSCDATSRFSGNWRYQATQDVPVPGTLSGSLVITAGGCGDFQGAFDVVEVLATGESRRIAGPLSGTLLDSTLARFEVVLDGIGREHLARIVGDSLTGSWVESNGSPPGSGQFGGHRQ